MARNQDRDPFPLHRATTTEPDPLGQRRRTPAGILRSIVPLPATLLLFGYLSSCAGQGPQQLPVALSVDSTTAQLEWSDAGGPLTGEVPWILRTDLLGPATYLVAVTADAPRQCLEDVTFGVRAADAVDYTVTLESNLEGGISWKILTAKGDEVRTFRCTPRPTGGKKECVRGGIPRPLLGTLRGDLTGTAATTGATVVPDGIRFEQEPTECLQETD